MPAAVSQQSPASVVNPFFAGSVNPFGSFATGTPTEGLAGMFGGLGGTAGPHGGMPDLAAMQEHMRRNPEAMRQMMANPIVQQMMQQMAENPSSMLGAIEQNPQMQQLFDQNPELRDALQDPELLRRSMRAAADPEYMRAMMEQRDRAMNNIQSQPGGFNALRRLHSEIQEPMLEASQAAARNAIGADMPSLAAQHAQEQANASLNSARARMNSPNSQALPNPWGGNPSSTATPSSPPAAANANSMANPFARVLGNMGVNEGAPAAGPAGIGVLMQNPMVQQMMQQMASNPDLMRQAIEQNPMAQEMMRNNPQARAMLENPQLMQQLLQPDNMQRMMQMQQIMGGLGGAGGMGNLGAGAGRNPGTAQNSGGMPPGLLSVMQSPMFQQIQQQMRNNPEMMQQQMNMVQGMIGGGSGMGFGGAGRFGEGAPASSTSNPWSSPNGTTGRPAVATGAGSGPATPAVNPWANMAPSGHPSDSEPTSALAADEERFATQLEQLESMGFTDRSSNISALRVTNGIVHKAVERLLGGM